MEGGRAGDAMGDTGTTMGFIITLMDSIIMVMDSIIITLMDSIIIIVVVVTDRLFSSTTTGHIVEWLTLASAGRAVGSTCGPFSSAGTL